MTTTHLRAPATVVLPETADLVADVVVDEARRTSTAYVDTDDLALLRWGAALVHDGAAWRLDLPAHDAIPDSPLVHRWNATSSTPPAAALRLLPAFLRGRSVSRVARVATRRVTRDLRDGDGAVLLHVHDDEVSVFHGRRLAERFREIVLEPVADTAPVDALAARLEANGASRIDARTRVLRLLGPQALEPADVPAGELGGDATAGDVIRAAIADSVRRLVFADPHARLGIDDEGVHQARVATRRLRSDLRTFRPLLDEDWDRDLRAELKWLAAALGRVRDADVLTGRLAAAVAQLTPAQQTGAQPLKARLAREREGARQDLRAVLDSGRYIALLDRLVAAANEPALLPAAADPAADTLHQLVRHPWRKLDDAVDALADDAADPELHAVRIRTKRARYAAEAVAPAVGKPARRFARAAARVQTVLGDHQDAIVAAAWLGHAARDLEDAHQAFVAGLLAGAELAAAREHRADWQQAWRKLDRKKVRGWL